MALKLAQLVGGPLNGQHVAPGDRAEIPMPGGWDATGTEVGGVYRPMGRKLGRFHMWNWHPES